MSYKNPFSNQYLNPYYAPEKADLAEKFLKSYEAVGQLSDKMLYAKRPTYHYGRITDFDAYSANSMFTVEREQYYEINSPQHRFKELVERDRYMDELEEECRRYQNDRERQNRDADVRAKNATVQKAWDKYKMLLELAR